MKSKEKKIEELETAKKLVKFLEKGYGKDKCKGYYAGCINCEAQLLRGRLWQHIDFLEEDLK